MSLLAATGLAGFLPLLLVLACPLLMVFMMRGMHGSHGHGDQSPLRKEMSLDELKKERDELNDLIGERAETIVHSRGYRDEARR